MKDKYSFFLLSIGIGMLGVIAVAQFYELSLINQNNNLLLLPYMVFTLTGIMISIAVLGAREVIVRETKRKAYMDVTGVQNKQACMEHMKLLEARDNTFDIGLAMFDMNNLKKINDYYGHDKGDELIRNFAQFLKKAVEKKCFSGRFGGDEFILIAEGCSYTKMTQWLKKIDMLVEEYNNENQLKICYAKGFEISNREHYYAMEDLLKKADQKMYQDKRKVKNIAEIIDRDEQYCNMNGNACEVERQFYKILQRDQLTGLLTCEAFLEKVSEILKSDIKIENLAIFCSDISDFRYLNDNFGYQVGNQVLKDYANKILETQGFLCASRIFSDNFAYVIDVTGKTVNEAIENAQKMNNYIAEKIQNKYKRSYFLINTGIYFMKDRKENPQDLFNCANTARKVAKNSYQHVQIYSENLENIEKKRAEMLHSFKKAIEEEEFCVYMQPKVNGQTREICGAEALVRWKMGGTKIRRPDEFIPLFEQTGDIIELDYYVYNQVFEWLSQQKKRGKQLVPISINVSRVHLLQTQQFLSYIGELQKKYGISSQYIIFEITESAFIQNMDVVKQMIESLHKMNFKVSMDDFGSGYSSLNSLKNLSFDEIKLDKDFLVHGMSEEGKVVLHQMISMIKKLKKIVVCEGVETREEVEFLCEKKCDVLQGYFFYKPMPIERMFLTEKELLA